MLTVSDFRHDYAIRVVAETAAAILRDRSRLSFEALVGSMNSKCLQFDEEIVTDALRMLEACHIAWRDVDGNWASVALAILFLDDNEQRHTLFRDTARGHAITHCYTAKEAIEQLATIGPQWDTIYLDHDLAGHKETGSTVANWLAKYSDDYNSIPVVIHSMNPVGGKYMLQTLERAGYTVMQTQFNALPPITMRLWLKDRELGTREIEVINNELRLDASST